MFCSTCGHQVDENLSFCPHCGSPLAAGAVAASTVPAADGVAAAAMPLPVFGGAAAMGYTGTAGAGAAASRPADATAPTAAPVAPAAVDAAPIASRPLALVSLTAFEVYMCSYSYKLGRALDRLEGVKRTPDGPVFALLWYATLGIYGIYVNYQQMKRIAALSSGYGIATEDKGTLLVGCRVIGAALGAYLAVMTAGASLLPAGFIAFAGTKPLFDNAEALFRAAGEIQ